MTRDTRRQPVVFLFGPTAVGKTEFLLSLDPDRYEIVNADSLQVYRRLDIGTAKPSPRIRERLAHHIIDIINPDEQFDVGAYGTRADRAIAEISSRGRTPVVCGGAAFYLKHVIYGPPPAPPSTAASRAAVRERLRAKGLAALYAELREVDPATADRVAPADEYRITRALEVYERSGRPLSAFPLPSRPRSDLAAELIGLYREKPELHARMADRIRRMFTDGLRGEVAGLVRDGYTARDPGLRGIGYREFFAADGTIRPPSDDERMANEIFHHTRQYAKRQLTFFRSLSGVRWIHAERSDEVLRSIETFVDRDR